MNEHILKGNWKQLRGRAKQWWGRLTDDDLDRIDGSAEELAGVLQERYGYERAEAVARSQGVRIPMWENG